MRTSMNLPDALLDQARARAVATNRTVTSIVEEALRLLLASEAPTPSPRVLPTYGSPEASFLVDLEDRDALWDALDAS